MTDGTLVRRMTPVEWSHGGNMNLEYPCPTIKAIEKELG